MLLVFVHKINPNYIIRKSIHYIDLVGEFIAFDEKVNFKNA